MTRGKGKPAEKGFIYFMRRADGVGPVKIGCSKWPAERLAMFASWSPEPLEIVTTAQGTFRDESRIHRQFAEYRLHSEWFEAAPPVLAMVASVARNGVLPPTPASDRTAQIKAMYAAGRTLQSIADEFGVSRQRIEQIAREEGLQPRGRVRPSRRAVVWGKLAEVRSLAASGCTLREIADAIGCTYANVSFACRAEGITVQKAKRGPSQRITAEAFEVAKAYKAGRTTKEIADAFSRQQPEVYRLLRVAGVKPNRIRRSATLPTAAISAAYLQGSTLQELADQFGATAGTIKRHLQKAGVKLRTRAESEAIRIARVTAANYARRAA